MSRKLILIAVTILGAALCIDSAYASEPGLFNRKKKARTEQKDTTKKLSPYVELFKKEQKKAQGMHSQRQAFPTPSRSCRTLPVLPRLSSLPSLSTVPCSSPARVPK